jgi:hypothetical protein
VKLHIEITDEQEKELLAEATNGMDAAVLERLLENGTLRRIYIRAAIQQRLPQ